MAGVTGSRTRTARRAEADGLLILAGRAGWVAAAGYFRTRRYATMGRVMASVHHANRWIRGAGDSYDAAGNQLSLAVYGSYGSAGSTFAYDGENRLIAANVAGGAGAATFVYDARGTLVAESGNEPADSGTLPTGTEYLTADHLGSTRLATDSSGNVIKRYDYLPFGEEIWAGTDGRSTDYNSPIPLSATQDVANDKFTGKERDSETGLDFFGARYFSGAQGRFTSPDPKQFTLRTIAYPQKWNKYAYVQNNPLAMIDPDGEDDFYVFRPLATENGRRWDAIRAEAPKYGNTVTIYNGNDATAGRFTNALNTEGAHVIDAGGHSVEDNQGNAVGILLGGNTGVGSPAFTTDVGPAGTPLVPVGNIQASDVAVFGCNSTQLAPQFSDTTFTGTRPTTNTVAEDTAAATYTDKLVRGGTVDQAATAAAGTMRTVTNQANANPNRVMDYKKPQVCTTEDGKTTCH